MSQVIKANMPELFHRVIELDIECFLVLKRLQPLVRLRDDVKLKVIFLLLDRSMAPPVNVITLFDT
jgi:hypothetical protein